ncbi:hypothetical protein [Rhodocyclus purpureus]|uniref:hypothetical protein n=1 Tax=Rhodocyclus purpureus TaxID=1067 RepID=UPI001914432E|nr:hypothetical protein [Rhodocyclus purpureus]MBK5914707.1 hypothetical protein [Rhodocyclus purpureus]
MGTYLATIAAVFALLVAGIGVDRLYRRFAAQNPELGPFRSSDGCSCCAQKNSCTTKGCD